jgi:hypothetical protein
MHKVVRTLATGLSLDLVLLRKQFQLPYLPRSNPKMPNQLDPVAKSLKKTNVPSAAKSFHPKDPITTIQTALSTLKNVSPCIQLLQAQQQRSHHRPLPVYPLSAPEV